MKINGKTILSTLSTSTNFVLKQSSTTGTLINSQIFDDGTNIGIGTTTPTSKLTVNDSTAFSWGFPSLASAKIGASGTGGSFMVMTPSLNSSYESGFAVDGTYNSGKSVINLSAFGVYSGGSYSADIAFKTATNTTLSEKMRITNDGNVGIGTTSPSSILHLNSAIPFLSIQGSTTGSLRGINIMQGSTVFSSLSAEASAGETRLSAGFSGWGGFQTFYTNGSERIRITSAGNVGIGISSPDSSALLEIRSSTQGFLPPRMTTSERDNINSPANGLMIFNTDNEQVDVFANGSGWRTIAWV